MATLVEKRSVEEDLYRLLHSPKRIAKSMLIKVQEIGSGSFAIVDLCWLTTPNSKTLVAVKRYRQAVLSNAAALKLLAGEISILTEVKHRHIVKILGLGCDEGKENDLPNSKLFLVQEYLTGGSMRTLVAEQSIDWRAYGLKASDLLGWSLQLAQSVAYLHQLTPPILHRDCKLENVMLTTSPSKKWGGVDITHTDSISAEVRLIDFGLAITVGVYRSQFPLSITLPDAVELSQAVSIHGASSYLDLVKLEKEKGKQRPGGKKSSRGSLLLLGRKRHDGSVGGMGSSHSKCSIVTEQLDISKHGGGLYDPYVSRPGSETSADPVPTYSGPIPSRESPSTLNPLAAHHYPPGSVESTQNGTAYLSLVESQVGMVQSGREKRLSTVANEASNHSTPNQSSPPSAPAQAHLTGMTGSLLYMAPEVFKGLDYGTKADVFSFGVCLWELVHRRLVFSMVFERNFGADDQTIQKEIFLHAASVSTGYRPPINDSFVPPSLAGLISECWAQNPSDRPSMKVVVDRLHSILRVESLTAVDTGPGGQGCGCIVS